MYACFIYSVLRQKVKLFIVLQKQKYINIQKVILAIRPFHRLQVLWFCSILHSVFCHIFIIELRHV